MLGRSNSINNFITWSMFYLRKWKWAGQVERGVMQQLLEGLNTWNVITLVNNLALNMNFDKDLIN